MANKIGVTISKQNISVCHRLPPTNPRSRLKIAKFVRSESKFRVMTQETILKNSSKNIYNNDGVKLLRAKLAIALRQRHDVKYVTMFKEKVVLRVSNDKRYRFSNIFDFCNRDMEIVHSVCFKFGHFWPETFQMKRPQPFFQKEGIKFLAKTMKKVEKAMNGFFTPIFVRLVKTLIN